MEENQTISDKLNLVLQYKNNIKTAINSKGQTATDDMSTYSSLIEDIVDYTNTIDPTEYAECLSITNNILNIQNSDTTN